MAICMALFNSYYMGDLFGHCYIGIIVLHNDKSVALLCGESIGLLKHSLAHCIALQTGHHMAVLCVYIWEHGKIGW